MNAVRGKVAVVTGAGSGIGRQLALELARRGARLAVSDVDETGLAETVAEIKALGAEAEGTTLDVGDRAAFVAYAAAVAGRFGVVHQVYNNAGIAGGGQTILETDWESYDRTLAVNLFGVINGTKAFLPHLIDSGDGHVVNVSSLNGFMAQPTLTAYCASKFGVRGFTEALRTEMIRDRHPVHVTVVHPGGVKTGIASSALKEAQARGIEPTAEQLERVRLYNEKLLKMPAERAARIIVDGVEAGKPRVLVGNDAKLVDRLVRLFPRHYPKLIVDFERRRFARS
ncbi:SDR family NAD(P)-dependent oxidoreductase [Amycolatopsis regifaucium]|uniref:Acetoin dehydrogenase n=1 Tax=Amycolatopsis regifaucium TaxID=546365 RepID=A0A154MM96_9PSEU|nr:SDR family NAD(P)-dependent oxidoreductase [Amycolatopsis regifaucium]KZB85375.1 acetoin dehydrogenase [Amycolatopsis regifaucium]OKA09018.1 acetoin dehydrogenase [Amycolatopsis regifaucium]SFJ39319.1 Short-chain dehydrogenase [Amycolatopsis regifaucium]